MKGAVQVVILGHEYTIKSEASAEEVQRVAVFVSERIKEAMIAGKLADSLDGTVLALMNVAGAYLRLQSRADDEKETTGRLKRLLRRLDADSPEVVSSGVNQ